MRAGERDPFVDAVLAEIGLTLDRRQPQTLDQLEDDYFDLIVTLAPEAHHTALDMNRSNAVEVVYWPTQDPSVVAGTRDQILAAYRQVRDHLKAADRGPLRLRKASAARSINSVHKGPAIV